jgi:hypothetical protein
MVSGFTWGRQVPGPRADSAMDTGKFERGPRIVPGKLCSKRNGNRKQDEGKDKGRSVQCHDFPPV